MFIGAALAILHDVKVVDQLRYRLEVFAGISVFLIHPASQT